MIYALTDADGLPSFYDDAVHPEIPEGAFEISEAQWQDWLSHPGQRRWDATSRDLVPVAPRPAPVTQPYLTGRDVVDGMSPVQAKAADAEDPRNLARISAARTAAEVKSCVTRVAKANGIETTALLAQATPTGGA